MVSSFSFENSYYYQLYCLYWHRLFFSRADLQWRVSYLTWIRWPDELARTRPSQFKIPREIERKLTFFKHLLFSDDVIRTLCNLIFLQCILIVCLLMWKNTRKEEMQGSYFGLWCRRVSCQSCFKGILSGASYGIAVEEQRKEWLCSFWWLSHFPIFIWYKSQVSKMVLPIFRVNLIFPVKPLCEHPHKHA